MTRGRYRLKPRIALEGGDAGAGGVLVDTHSGMMHGANETAWFVLGRLHEGSDVDGLSAALTAAFAVDELAARRDVNTLLSRLIALDMVAPEDG